MIKASELQILYKPYVLCSKQMQCNTTYGNLVPIRKALALKPKP